MGDRSRLEHQKKQKKDALFASALELFTAKGFSRTAISDIVSQAGVAKGTFYLYFKDKLDIHNQLIAQKAAEVCHNAYNTLAHVQPQTYEDRILCFTDQVINQLRDNPALLRFISKNLSWGILKTAILDEAARRELHIEQIYESMRDTQGCTFTDPDVLFYMIMELVSATCYNSILHGIPVPIDALKPHMYRAIRAMIRSQLSEPGAAHTPGSSSAESLPSE